MNKNNKYYAFHGYRISLDGEILNSSGKKMKISEDGHIWLQIDGKKRRRLAGRIVYEAVTKQRLGRDYVLVFQDGDCTNIAFANISAVKRKDFFKDFDWQKLKKISPEQQKVIRLEFTNGKSKQQLARDYDCCVPTITKIVNGTY